MKTPEDISTNASNLPFSDYGQEKSRPPQWKRDDNALFYFQGEI
ncbi:hypothetical protein ACFL2V_11775 [Pseudomonadota bacterium]